LSQADPTSVLKSHLTGLVLNGVAVGTSRTTYGAPQLALSVSPATLQVLAFDPNGRATLHDLWVPAEMDPTIFELGAALAIPVLLTLDPKTHSLRMTVRRDLPLLPAPKLNPQQGDH
jgi:hypothetical protein